MKAIKKKEISPTNGAEKLLSGLEEEKSQFKKIQSCFAEQFDKAFPDKLAPKTVMIIPSLTMDQEILSKIQGITHYEERLIMYFYCCFVCPVLMLYI